MTDVRTPHPGAARAVVAGWAGVVVFAGLMAVTSDDSLGNAALFGVLGAVMGCWVAVRRSGLSLWVSLFLGGLHTVEQTAYLVASVADGDTAAVLFTDVVGLVAGLLVTGGAAAALWARRRGRATDRHQDQRTGAAA